MGILNAITGVFDAVGTWIQTAISNLIPVFWTEGTGGASGSLTLMGVLAVVGLAFSVVFLILHVITKFLHFEGR